MVRIVRLFHDNIYFSSEIEGLRKRVQKRDNDNPKRHQSYTLYTQVIVILLSIGSYIFFFFIMFLYLLFFLVLFHRAILLSGSPLSPLSLVRDPVYYGHQVAKLVNCSPELQHLHLLNCLRDTSLEKLLNAQLHVPEFTTAFGPSVDGVIIDVGTAAESSRTNSQSSEKNNSLDIRST